MILSNLTILYKTLKTNIIKFFTVSKLSNLSINIDKNTIQLLPCDKQQ